jgi:dTDP-4-amino-4,6-dideoxygalactose transaminase
LDPFQAMILERQLPSLDAQNEIRRRICRIYEKNLPPGWQIVYGVEDRFVAHLAVVLAPTEWHRNRGRQELSLRDIGNDIHYPVLDCDQPGWKGLGRASGNLITSRALTKRILSLPCFPELTDDEIEQVVDAFQAFE